ncbi:MAG: S9 family peptidase [Proteobacteria bacterium]|nr:S9 family peptidase [Pseudomonadota bacterium]
MSFVSKLQAAACVSALALAAPALAEPAAATAPSAAPQATPPAAATPAKAEPAKPAAEPLKQPTIDDFLADPALAQASLSPSGRYVAYVRSVKDQQRVAVFDLEERKGKDVFAGASPGVTGTSHLAIIQAAGIEELNWKGDDRLVVTTYSLGFGASDGMVFLFREPAAFVVDRTAATGPKQVLLARANSKKPADPKDAAHLAAHLPNDPNHILVLRTSDRNGALYRYDVRDGSAEQIEAGQSGVTGYQLDSTGTVVARTLHKSGFLHDWAVIEGRAPGQSQWTKIAEVHAKDVRKFSDFEFLGPTSKPGEVYVAVRPKTPADGDTTAVRVFDFKTMSLGAPVWSNPKYDVVQIVQNPADGTLLGGCYWVDVLQCDFADKTLAANLKGLSKFFDGDRSLAIVSMSDDGRRWLLNVSGPDEPGTYFLYDRDKAHIEILGLRYPKLPTDALGKMERVAWKARDGAELHGYLTLPPEMPAYPKSGAPPLIVMPHGGPEARDHFEFDLWSQFLATRGYAVFQPNFRGSDGFGRAFAEAGYHEWGGRMQDDVTDGVRAVLAQGKADPAKVCIVGASYGGYAALYGGATQPDLYKCVVAIAGVSDLNEMLEWERSTFGADSDHYTYWTKAIGDTKADHDRLKAKSPAQLASTYAIPVLLIHGTADEVVPVKQSRGMERALKKAGKPVKFVEVGDEGHGDWSAKDNALLLNEMEAFLGKHLGTPRPSAPPEKAKDADKPADKDKAKK